MKGWIYIFTNRSMPGLIKIGYSNRDPSIRVSEQHSGLPYPHDLEYELLVDNPLTLEKKIHKELKEYNESKEWFNIKVEVAVSIIKEINIERVHLENFYQVNQFEVERIKYNKERKRQEGNDKRVRKDEYIQRLENQKKEIIQEYEKKLQLVDTRISLIRLISLTNLSKLLTIGFFLITMGPSYLFMIFLAFYTQVNFFIFSALLGLYPTFLIYREISESARINSPNYLRLISERDKKLKDITFLQSNTR